MSRALLEEAVEIRLYETSEEADANRLTSMLHVRGVSSHISTAPRGLFDLTPGRFRVVVGAEDLDIGDEILQEFLRHKIPCE